MTSPALLVLFLAHACSIFGTAPEGAVDGRVNTMRNRTHKPNQWTNIYKNLDHTDNEINIYKNIDDTNSEINNIFKQKEAKNVINNKIHDEIYTENEFESIDLRAMKLAKFERKERRFGEIHSMSLKKEVVEAKNRVKRDENDPRCKHFQYDDNKGYISHPHGDKEPYHYYNNSDCTTTIDVAKNYIIELTFVDKFRIENHPECAYDYLEIRDGERGYSTLLGRVCGEAFPRVMKTKGPHAWLKFHSDDTIEYEGFNIKVEKILDTASYSIPPECVIEKEEATHGTVTSDDIDPKCRAESVNNGLDVLWKIKTPENRKIFLNFTHYELKFPNECDQNGIQVFGSVLELSAKLEYYCGSVANPVTTKDDKGEEGNIMHIRLYTSKNAMDKKATRFEAQYTAFRTINPAKESDACNELEFDCADNTCIDKELKCNNVANCRLKTDEDVDVCKQEASSPIGKLHILVILVIFSLILSTMMFVFLFKCIKKLYQDHKIIKEHIRQSCEDRLDRLDSIVGSRLTLDAKRLQRDSEPRASLERENHANEMFKRKKESFSKRQPTSIDSDFQETHIDLDEEIWRREVETQIQPEDILIERNGRSRRRDIMSKREESIRSKRESEERKEIRDVSVGAPDTKESGCQTRESLFQTDPPPSSDGKSSSSNSRGFSTFGYSGATIVRPSPPTNTSEIRIELLKQVPRQESVKPLKKIDRRPMSSETTRSAPDVIIVSKPIR